MEASTDPYELKLYQMFQSCDADQCGFLDEVALRRLCGLLELRDKGAVLIADLTAAGMKTHVSFDQFKEALLNFLGTELDGGVAFAAAPTYVIPTYSEVEANTNALKERTLVINDGAETYLKNPPESSDREVSPKLVVGTKKYGRRSRPQSQTTLDDFSLSDSENDEQPDTGHRKCSADCFDNKLVQRSSSQTDIPESRRRRPPVLSGNRLKRCSSLPTQRNNQSISKSISLKSKSNSTTNKRAQTSHNSSATASQQLLNSGVKSLDIPMEMEAYSADSIVDIWERASITNGKRILLALGFDEDEINLAQLHRVLEDEMRTLEDESQFVFPRALLALQSTELSTLRQSVKQLCDEIVQLRLNNKDANRRVAMLAAEIDEHHASLEDTSKNEIRILEQRQAAVVRDFTARMAADRENWTNLTARLEMRIRYFEQEEIKLKTELELVRKENNDLEGEQQKLQKQVTELLEKNIELNREIANFEDSTRCGESICTDSKTSDDEILHLMEKISVLQLENTQLRDKNDELVVEVENYNLELSRLKLKYKKPSVSTTASLETDETSNEEGSSSTATKRRGDSPSKTRITEESPRLGKLRKYTNDVNGSENSDTSGEWMALNSELQNSESKPLEMKVDASAVECTENVGKLRERISALEEQLAKLKEPLNNTNTTEERCKELETSLEQMQRAYEDCEDYWQSKLSEERQLFEKERQIYEEEQQESDKKFTELMEKVREYEEQFSKDGRLSPIEEKYTLEQQYAELEAEINETREKAQKLFETKSQEIESLQNEVEDLRLRLGESVEILTGATELNTEAFMQRNDDHLSAASSPISYLWHQSTIQEPAKSYPALENLPLSILTPPTSSSKQANRINLSTSETAIFSTTPVETASFTVQIINPQVPLKKLHEGVKLLPEQQSEGDVADCETSSTASGKSFETHSVASSLSASRSRAQCHHQTTTKPNSSQENMSISPSDMKEELKRLKFFQISLKDQIKDLSLQRDGLVMELQQLQEARPVLEKAYARTAHPTLIQRVNQLELKNRHLQNVIKQQQIHTDSLMQQSWRQHQIELTELHGRIETQSSVIADQAQRLQNADILVKDLYVENSHLTATVQRMEQQRVRTTMMQHQPRQGLNGLPGLP